MPESNPTSEIGKVYGLWTVLRYGQKDQRGCKLWICRCECGTERPVLQGALRFGRSASCGCQKRNARAEHVRTWDCWSSMNKRCRSLLRPMVLSYAGRGITVCQRWKSFDNFLADMGEKPAGLTLDRINNDAGYFPGNCQWAKPKEQARNRRGNVRYSFDGLTLTQSEWAERTGLSQETLYYRINKAKWSVERALTTPLRKW